MESVGLDCNLSYIAGFFDADGSIGVYRRKSMASSEFYLQFGNNDPTVLYWIEDFFEVGKVRLIPGTKCYVLEIRQRSSIRVILRALLPYLRVKHVQALIALEALDAGDIADWATVDALGADLKSIKRKEVRPVR